VPEYKVMFTTEGKVMKSMDAFKKYLVKRKTVKSAVQAAVAPVSAEKKEKTRNKARFLSVSPSI